MVWEEYKLLLLYPEQEPLYNLSIVGVIETYHQGERYHPGEDRVSVEVCLGGVVPGMLFFMLKILIVD